MMSVGFIAFVTVLHIIGKVRQFFLGGDEREREKEKEIEETIDLDGRGNGDEAASAHAPLPFWFRSPFTAPRPVEKTTAKEVRERK